MNKTIQKFIVFSVLCCVLFVNSVWALSTESGSEGSSIDCRTFVEVSKKVLPTVVSINVKKTIGKSPLTRKPDGKKEEELKKFFEKRGFQEPFDEFFPFFFPFEEGGEIEIPASGSGVIISSEGYIITNNHVISGAKENNISIRMNDDTVFEGDDVEIIGEDEFTDLAVLKVKTDKKLPALEFANSDALEIGEWVLAIGNPLELKGSVSQGIISAKHRVIGKAIIEDLIQTTASINPGNSGGPLVNLDNKIVGINTAIASNTGRWQGVGFAIPSNTVKNVCQSIIETGKAQRGWIGIYMGELTSELRNYFDLKDVDGIIVTKVIEDGPAEKAGIKSYDIITAVDGEKIKNRLEMVQKIAPKAVGQEVVITLLREKNKKLEQEEITVTLGERPAREELESSTKQKSPDKSPNFEKMGISFKQKEEGSDKKGLEIEEIKRGSPADKAGLLPGDIILEINRNKVESLEDFNKALEKEDNERDHFVMYQRGNEIFFSTMKEE